MNETVLNAITATNEAAQKQVEAQAQELVGYILSEQATITRLQGEINSHREELEKTAHDVINVESVTGGTFPVDMNISQTTIAKVIGKLNEEKQKSVEVVAQRLTSAITQKQASIKATEKRISELREKLEKLQAPVATPASVLG